MPFTSASATMPFTSDLSNSLAVSLTDAWAVAQDSIQFFAQTDGFQGEQLAPAFGTTLSTERLQALGEQVVGTRQLMQ